MTLALAQVITPIIMKSASLKLLFVISELSRLTTSVTHAETCHARAWVRAPNLQPGHVVQGDVKVKLDGSCDEVSSYVLGLRFAERSWVKTRREGVTLPTDPRNKDESKAWWRAETKKNSNGSVYDGRLSWHFWEFPGVDQPTLDQYENNMKDPALWLVREEERIAFETKFPLSDDEKPGRDIVKSFALLVPLTNYPPAFDTSSSFMRNADLSDDADAEHIYQYFVDVTFANGTHRQLEAGYTSFDTSIRPETDPESLNVTATRQDVCGTSLELGCQTEDGDNQDKITLEVTFPNGRHLEQGSIHNITLVSHQLGPGLQRPLKILFVFENVEHRRWWAAKHTADNKTAKFLLQKGIQHSRELRPTKDDTFMPSKFGWDRILPQFSQEGIIENGTLFSTESVAVQIEVPPQIYPPFDMYYQSSVVELSVGMALRNTSKEEHQSDEIDDEEYDWTPELRKEPTYYGHESVFARIPFSVYRKSDTRAIGSDVVHYLSPEARAPVFVDPSSVPRLVQMTAEERESLAPISEPKFVTRTDEQVVNTRYFGGNMGSPRRGQYYVGNTWLRKALGKNHDSYTPQSGALVIQG